MSIDDSRRPPGGGVLIVAAHPDDEVLGCGGVAARHAANGEWVDTLILAEGATARDKRGTGVGMSAEVRALREAASAAARILGAKPPQFAGLPDNRMDTVPLLAVVKYVEEAVERAKPALIYTHHGGDLNIDHRITHQAVITACRSLPGSCVNAVYAFETLSSTEWSTNGTGSGFRPTRFVAVGDMLERKLQALECYESEMRDFPHARSRKAVEAQAVLRGAEAGVTAAEAFEVVREIVRDE
jgi:LmbE family N-acetylglucosaminyl deacetylase